MAKYAVTEKMVDAAIAVLREVAWLPYAADARDFTDEEVKEGKLKEADEEAEAMNRALVRHSLEAAFDLISQEPK